MSGVASPDASSSSWHWEMPERSEEHTSELQSIMRISYSGFCFKKKNKKAIQENNAPCKNQHNPRKKTRRTLLLTQTYQPTNNSRHNETIHSKHHKHSDLLKT